MDDLSASLPELGLKTGSIICLEHRGKNGFWPFDETSSIKPRIHTPGVVGLQNVGNTCFMNSGFACSLTLLILRSIHALSNTPYLADYFKEEYHRRELNISNPLGINFYIFPSTSGCKGEIAWEFGNLIDHLWTTDKELLWVSPAHFKSTTSRWNPTFAGMEQHVSTLLRI